MAIVVSLVQVLRARLRLARARSALAAASRRPGTAGTVDRDALDAAGMQLVVLADAVPAGSARHRLTMAGLGRYAHAAASAALLDRGLDAYRHGRLGPPAAGTAADRGLAGLAALEEAERRIRAHGRALGDTERVLRFLSQTGQAGTDPWRFYRAAFDAAFAAYLDADIVRCALDRYAVRETGALERYRTACAAMDEAERGAEAEW